MLCCLECQDNDPFEPVVTRCGHVYCWKCLYISLKSQNNNFCPNCKLQIDINNDVIPIYTRDKEVKILEGQTNNLPTITTDITLIPRRPLGIR
jgi:hypothetical protein